MINPKTIIEFIGTAILVFTIQVSGSSDLAPLAIGGILIAIVFAGGPISGAHYNPAVSCAVKFRGSMETTDMIAYMTAQLLGGILGGFAGGIVSSSFSVVAVGEDATLLGAYLAEAIFTFILCFVVLLVATNPAVEDNHYYGLAIGLVVMAGAITVGPISGGAFNPAVALGLSISGGLSNIFYAAVVSGWDMLGSILAVGCYVAVLPSIPRNDGTGIVNEGTQLVA